MTCHRMRVPSGEKSSFPQYRLPRPPLRRQPHLKQAAVPVAAQRVGELKIPRKWFLETQEPLHERRGSMLHRGGESGQRR